MARTKQTARKNTGGKAPKKQLSSASSKPPAKVSPSTSFTFTAKELTTAFSKAGNEATDAIIEELKDAQS